MSEIIKPPTPLRTFELVVPVTGPLEGGMDDWPANIQDGIFAAMERKAKDVESPLCIVHARCDFDHDVTEGSPYYIHVILSEVVLAVGKGTRH